MTTIYVKIIRWEKNGKEEIFRTTKPNNYVPQGATLVKELSSFVLCPEEPITPPKPEKKFSLENFGCGLLVGVMLVSLLLIVVIALS